MSRMFRPNYRLVAANSHAVLPAFRTIEGGL